jgi:hypothetical protein
MLYALCPMLYASVAFARQLILEEYLPQRGSFS